MHKALVVVAFCLLPVSTPSSETTLQAELQARLTEICNQAGYPGVTVAVALPNGSVVSAAAGWADASHTVALKATDRMPAGSVGKTFVAAEILQAVDRGELDLDSKIERWIGQEPWFGRIPNAHELTLRLLLSHRSGLPDPQNERAFIRALTTNLEKVWTPLEISTLVFDQKPRFAAGKKYFYTDANYNLAGLVFEAATGRKLFSEIDRTILGPLSLTGTTPTERSVQGVVPGKLDPNTLGIRGESIQKGRFVYNPQMEYGGGGIVSNSPDLARWAQALWGGKVVSESALQQMLDVKPSEGSGSYGLGVEAVHTGAGVAYMHDGWIPGYITIIIYFPEKKVAAALQINSDPDRHFKPQPGHCLSEMISLALHNLRAESGNVPD